MAERISPVAIAAALDVLDGQAKRVAGDQLVVSIGFTNAAVKDLGPREHEELAAYLFALIGREPMKTSPAFAGHRLILGSLAMELRGFAAAAGEPVGMAADLRAASSQAEERRIRARIADQALEHDRHVDDVIASHQAQQQAQQRAQQQASAPEEEPIAQAPTEPPLVEPPDDTSWL